MRFLFFLVVTFVLASSAFAVDELPGTRAQALQGGLASPLDNASIYLNPAGAGLYPRYDLTAYGEYRLNAPDRSFNVSLLDSKSTKELGAGVAWNRRTGRTLPRDDLRVAVAQKYAVGAFGVGVHYGVDRERERRSEFNFDSGFVIDPWEGILKSALVAYNMTNTPKGVENVRRSFGLGLAGGIPKFFEVTGDLHYTHSLPKGNRIAWSAGGEFSALEFMAFRAGFGQAPAGPNRKNRISGGLAGIAAEEFDIGYAVVIPLENPKSMTHSAEISLMFF